MGLPQESLHELRSEGDLNISPKRAAWAKKNIDARTQKWLDEDARYFLHQSLSTPCLNVLSSCEGIYIEDLQGNRIMDFHGNYVHQVGFRNKRVIEAIIEQLNTLPFCTRRYTNVPAIRLAGKLAELAPGKLNKALFRKGMGPLLPGTEHVPPPDPLHCPFVSHKDCSRCDLKCADYIEYVLEKEGDIAAVISETIRSTPFIPPPGYWEKVRAACTRHGALLILDEIPHCLGRTGKMFTCQNFNLIPDLLVIGKGLGGGIFHLAALIAREDLDIMKDRD